MKSSERPAEPQGQNGIAELRAQVGTERRERTRARILGAAFDLAGTENGLRVRIEEICAKAGISRGTFYNYFMSVDELYNALWLELTQEQSRLITASVSRIDSATARTYVVLTSLLRRARSEKRWAWAMVNLAANGLIFGQEAYARSLALVEHGVKSGEFEVDNLRAGRDIIYGALLVGMVTQLKEKTNETFPMEVARLVLRSLGAQPKRVAEIIAKEGRLEKKSGRRQ